jgi:hypothetical protein
MMSFHIFFFFEGRFTYFLVFFMLSFVIIKKEEEKNGKIARGTESTFKTRSQT